MAKRKKKNNFFKNNKTNIILIAIIVILLISNIITLVNYISLSKEEPKPQEVLYTKTEDKYNFKEKYYTTIKYSDFKKKYKSTKVTTIAVLNNTSNTTDRFLEMINKISFYKSTKISLLELGKLSKKNEASFYELDERLKKIENNYIITVSNGKIISITTFDNTELLTIIEGIGE